MKKRRGTVALIVPALHRPELPDGGEATIVKIGPDSYATVRTADGATYRVHRRRLRFVE